MDQEQIRDKAIDNIFDRFDTILENKEYEKCNRILRSINVERITTTNIITILTATLIYQEYLPDRVEFLLWGRKVVTDRDGVEIMMANFKGLSE